MRLIQLLLLSLLTLPLLSQWQGDVGKYEIFPDSLQLNEVNSEGGTAFIYQESAIIEDANWQFNVKMLFNPSGSNYARVYLVSDVNDFSGNGYYVKIGGTSDEVSLFRQDGNNHQKIIDGVDDRVDVSSVDVSIKVTRDKGHWILYSDSSQTGFKKEGEVTDLTYLTSSFFGVQSNYTKSRSQHFTYSQFQISGSAFVDDVAPRLDSVICVTKYESVLYFNEDVNVNDINHNGDLAKQVSVDGKVVSAKFDTPFIENDSNLINISVEDTSGNALIVNAKAFYTSYEVLFASMQSSSILEFRLNKTTAVVLPVNVLLDGQHPSSVVEDNNTWLATFSNPINTRENVSLVIENVLDVHGDSLKRYVSEVSYFEAQMYDLVFNELMPDPSPKLITLPEVEYVELYNTTDFDIPLTGWYIQRDTSTTYLLPLASIKAHSFLLLGSEAAMDSFPYIENKVSMPSFPSLVNGGMTLKLKTDNGVVIDSLTYSSSWYSAETKNGGYALSRISATQSSVASNFQSSCAPEGGTPGAVNCDLPPTLVSAKILTKYAAILYFDEGVSVSNVNYAGNNAIRTVVDTNSVQVEFADAFVENDSNVIIFSVQDVNSNSLQDDVALYYMPFEVISAEMGDAQHLNIVFNKELIEVPLTSIELNDQMPTSVVLDSGVYVASFNIPIEERSAVYLEISDILDINGDSLKRYSDEITYFIPRLGDLVFTELMPDPSPVISSLPEAEYIELFNNSNFSINIGEWYLLKDQKRYTLPIYQLPAKEYLILTSEGNQSLFSDSIKSLAMSSFPSLNNSAMSLQLVSTEGILVDFIDYENSWHEDAFKADGGFSLERIDIDNPSQLTNWTSSCSDDGGTPGLENCVSGDNPDYDAPYVVNAYALDNSFVMIDLSEPILNSELQNIDCFSLSGGITINSSIPLGELVVTQQVMLGLSTAMTDETVYELIVEGIKDLSGNELEVSYHNIAVCRLPEASEILINEVMFAPLSGEAEYVEIYNATDIPFDLSQIKVTKQEDDGSWAAGKALSDAPYILLPYSYLAISSDIELLTNQYSIPSDAVWSVSSMTTLGNESGSIAMLLSNATVIDVLKYSDEWHSALLNDTRGVALERLSADVATNESSNWFSASSSVNYGTPGLINSQSKVATVETLSEISVSPEVFTPNGDGIDDFTIIKFDEKYVGSTVRVQVFNHRGLVVKELSNNSLIGTYSDIRWDGTDDQGARCPMGSYIVWIEMVTPEGAVVVEKLECVVSVRMR